MNAWRYALSSADQAPASAPILLRGEVCDNLRTAAKLGYQGLEVHTREDAHLNYDLIRKVSADCGVSISAIVTGRLNTQGGVSLIDDRPYVVDAALKGMTAYIKMASRLNTDLVVGWIKGRVPEGADPRPFLDRLADNLSTICREADSAGVRVFVEVINRYEVNIFTTAKETLDFIEARSIPNCYLHLDTFHMNIGETNPEAAMRLCGKSLGYFHVADNTRLNPGSGTLDFAEYLAVLSGIGYAGYVSVECLPIPDGDTAASRALAHLKACERASAAECS